MLFTLKSNENSQEVVKQENSMIPCEIESISQLAVSGLKDDKTPVAHWKENATLKSIAAVRWKSRWI